MKESPKDSEATGPIPCDSCNLHGTLFVDRCSSGQRDVESLSPKVGRLPRLAGHWHVCRPREATAPSRAERSHLPPFRHVPIDKPYDAPLRVILASNKTLAPAVVEVATDGSARQQIGGHAAVVLCPYSEIEAAVVGKGRMVGDATNIQAEMQAAILGLRMMLQLYRTPGTAHPHPLADSMYVVQVLDESISPARHPGMAAELLSLWQRMLLCAENEVRWVKGHSHHLLNNLAGMHAKSCLTCTHTRVHYCKALTWTPL